MFEKFIEAHQQYVQATKKLLEEWQKADDSDRFSSYYPFEDNFIDVTEKVERWANASIDEALENRYFFKQPDMVIFPSELEARATQSFNINDVKIKEWDICLSKEDNEEIFTKAIENVTTKFPNYKAGDTYKIFIKLIFEERWIDNTIMFGPKDYHIENEQEIDNTIKYRGKGYLLQNAGDKIDEDLLVLEFEFSVDTPTAMVNPLFNLWSIFKGDKVTEALARKIIYGIDEYYARKN